MDKSHYGILRDKQKNTGGKSWSSIFLEEGSSGKALEIALEIGFDRRLTVLEVNQGEISLVREGRTWFTATGCGIKHNTQQEKIHSSGEAQVLYLHAVEVSKALTLFSHGSTTLEKGSSRLPLQSVTFEPQSDVQLDTAQVENLQRPSRENGAGFTPCTRKIGDFPVLLQKQINFQNLGHLRVPQVDMPSKSIM